MTKVVREETGSERLIFQLWSDNDGRHVVQQEHTFVDPSDGEVLEFKPGDILEVWREF
jgi:hypothetical protein